MKKMFKFFIIFCFIIYRILNANCMELGTALRGEEKIQLITLTRSGENTLVPNVEREMIHQVLNSIVNGKELTEFEYFSKILKQDINHYNEIPNILNNLKKKPDTSSKILKFRLNHNLVELNIFLPQKQINDLVDTFYKKSCWRKSDFKFCEESQQNQIWELLTQYDEDKEFLSKEDSYFEYKDKDIFSIWGKHEDFAFYQAMNNLKLKISSDASDVKDAFFSHYKNQWTNIKTSCEELKESNLLQKSDNCITMLVMNEYFFGKVAFDEDSVISEFKNRSKGLKNTIICTNFNLHKFFVKKGTTNIRGLYKSNGLRNAIVISG